MHWRLGPNRFSRVGSGRIGPTQPVRFEITPDPARKILNISWPTRPDPTRPDATRPSGFWNPPDPTHEPGHDPWKPPVLFWSLGPHDVPPFPPNFAVRFWKCALAGWWTLHGAKEQSPEQLQTSQAFPGRGESGLFGACLGRREIVTPPAKVIIGYRCVNQGLRLWVGGGGGNLLSPLWNNATQRFLGTKTLEICVGWVIFGGSAGI